MTNNMIKAVMAENNGLRTCPTTAPALLIIPEITSLLLCDT
jgi:hypothetical protein